MGAGRLWVWRVLLTMRAMESLSGFATMVATTEVSKIVYKILYCHTLLSL